MGPMAPAGSGMERCVHYAHMAYLWLPLFLGVVAGLGLLVTTLRKTITGGIAAALAALGGIVSLGVVLGFAIPHGGASGRPAPDAAPEAPAPTAELTRSVRELHAALERLQGRVVELEAKLARARARATEGASAPAASAAPAPKPATPAATATPADAPPPAPPSEMPEPPAPPAPPQPR